MFKIGQHVRISHSQVDGIIIDLIGAEWAVVKPDAGGWAKCVMISELQALDSAAVGLDKLDNDPTTTHHWKVIGL